MFFLFGFMLIVIRSTVSLSKAFLRSSSSSFICSSVNLRTPFPVVLSSPFVLLGFPLPVILLKEENGAALDTPKETKVYFEDVGAKYHTNAHCSGMRKPQYIPLSVAKKRGLSPCKKCAPYGVAPTVRSAPAAPLFASATTNETKPVFEFLSVKVAGVTFKNGRKSRQTILRKIHFKDEPFDKGTMELTLQREEWEGKPAFGVYVNGDQIGNIPAEQADYVNANFSRLDGIVNIEVYGGGDGQNYGAEITLRFRNE